MKKSKAVVLIITPVLSALLFSACNSSEPDIDTNRDVYQSKEDCSIDWSDEELCEQMNESDSNDYRSNGGVFVSRPFWGPQYYPGDRSVYYKGKSVTPAGKNTTMSPYVVTSRSSSTSRTGASSPGRSSTTTTGGFGSKSSSSSSSS
jgi:hypothetical protein